jgi:hypothetical protein
MAIEFEDRTSESAETEHARKVVAAGQLLALAAIRVSEATPAVGIGGLALALGQGAARIGVDLAEVLDAVRRHYEQAALAMAAARHDPSNEN